MKNYTVSYGTRTTEHDDVQHVDATIDPITLHQIVATNDYNFLSVLGPGVFYGITAEHFEQKMHIQTNFATNLYTNPGGANATEPDLSGHSSGVIVVSAFDDDSQVFIGQSHKGNILLKAKTSR